MAKVERGVVKPPNQDFQNLGANRSHSPRAASPATPECKPLLQGGSADLTRQPSPVAPAGNRFNVDNACMPQPPSAIEPGKGDVPINPFLANGTGIVRTTQILDVTKQH